MFSHIKVYSIYYMNRKLRITNLLKKNFIRFSIEVIDNSKHHVGHNNFDGLGETHFEIVLSSDKNDEFNRLEIHRKINNLLIDEFKKGLHSLQIKIK
tara:strand:- start:7 stop:297 length:291 start_codon:yes stop_codon:yes gene_type:complete